MKKVIISIVSAQTVPNFLFIKEYETMADLFLFISTPEMEHLGKTRTLVQTAGIDKKKVRKILIHEDELYLAAEKLDKLGWKNRDYQFLINITGGTKLMSNAVYSYFKDLNSRFFYLPLGKNIVKELFDDKPAVAHPIVFNISVAQYLSLHNIRYEEDTPLLNYKKTMELLERYKENNFVNFPDSSLSKSKLNTQQKSALWFEHFLYYKIKEYFKLDDKAIKQGIKLFEKSREHNISDVPNDNEIDIVFVKNNRCFIIEAKVSVGKNKVNTSAITNYLYKLAAVNKRFGINAKAALMLFADFSILSIDAERNLKKRCDILNLPYPFERNDIIDERRFKNKISTFVN